MTARPGRLVLLGHPVSHSLSPMFQNAALRAADLEVRYESLDVTTDTLPVTLRQLMQEGAAGNVTIPHKETVATHCDVLTPLAARVGAVNTWWTVDGRLHGDNTDVGGFDDAVTSLLGHIPDGARVALIGAGGSAKAVAAAVAAWPQSTLSIWSRSLARAQGLCALGPAAATTAEEFMANALRGADLVVHATPIGLHDEQVPFNPAILRPTAACLDLVYRRSGVTPFIAAARAHGLRADDGLRMLVAQGARSWARWFGDIVPDREVMHRAVVAPAGLAP